MNEVAEEFADSVGYERNKFLTRDIVIDIFNKGFYKGKEFAKKKHKLHIPEEITIGYALSFLICLCFALGAIMYIMGIV